MRVNTCDIEDLIAQQQTGYSLEQPFYTDPEIFSYDMDRVLSPQWHYVGHVS